MAGAAYTAGSARHMVVRSPADLVLVGVLLTLVGACLGWLGAALLSLAAREPDSIGNRDSVPLSQASLKREGRHDGTPTEGSQ
jgi:hypothetical protein